MLYVSGVLWICLSDVERSTADGKSFETQHFGVYAELLHKNRRILSPEIARKGLSVFRGEAVLRLLRAARAVQNLALLAGKFEFKNLEFRDCSLLSGGWPGAPLFGCRDSGPRETRSGSVSV